MDQYIKIREALRNLRFARITTCKDLINEANDELTKVVRHACGLD